MSKVCRSYAAHILRYTDFLQRYCNSVAILLAVMVFAVSTSFAKKSNLDSLYTILKTSKEDTNKVKTLNEISRILEYSGGYKRADSTARLALKLAQKLNYKNGIGNAYRQIGNACYDVGNYADALTNQLLGLKAYETVNDLIGMSYSYGNIGNIYYLQGNYPEALKNQLKALELDEKTGNKADMGVTYVDVGIVYGVQKNYEEALKNCFLGVKYSSEAGDSNSMGNAYGNIGTIYENNGEYDKALKYLQLSLLIAQKRGVKESEANAYCNIGDTYIDEKKYDDAFDAFKHTLVIDSAIGNKEGLGQAWEYMGNILTLQKRYPEAKKYLDKALKLGMEINEKENIMNTYNFLEEYDSATGDYKNAYNDNKKYVVYRDSLTNDENTKKIVSEQLTYDFDKKQAAEKAKQDERDAVNAATRHKQQIIIASIGTGLLLVIGFSILLFSRFRVTQKQKVLIEKQKTIVEEQKAIVEEKNKDITDSIHYASRIQRALLTTNDYIDKYLKEYFILFKPRDIVSGDFYWAFNQVSDNADNFYIACCDCTGHGVPGAFMSLLNISMLNESVVERKVSSPEHILNDVRTNIIKALNPEGHTVESKDGMDCALCAIDVKTNTIKAACANNPVWIVNKSGELNEITPDKMPVGVQYGEQKGFTLRETKAEKGDCIYLFTDGYADQFGGPKGKKFKYKQLQQLIMDNAKLSMTEQKEILEQAIESWKGNLEQVDDILIIGIRI